MLRYMAALVLAACAVYPARADSIVGHVGANVVTPATMTDIGTLTDNSPQPAQTIIVANPDGSITIRSDF
jgi:hypothetical protein